MFGAVAYENRFDFQSKLLSEVLKKKSPISVVPMELKLVSSKINAPFLVLHAPKSKNSKSYTLYSFCQILKKQKESSLQSLPSCFVPAVLVVVVVKKDLFGFHCFVFVKSSLFSEITF